MADRAGQYLLQIAQPVALPGDDRSGTALCQPSTKPVDSLEFFLEITPAQQCNTCSGCTQTAQPLRLVGHDQFRCTGRGRRPDVRDKVSNREIHLVANGAHDGYRTIMDCPSDNLFIE